jgi:hypothetical protein
MHHAGNGGAGVSPAGVDANAAENRRPLLHRDERDAGATLVSTVPVDLLFDNHAVELEECRRWANSDAGQVARIENPAGFANVKAHAEAHLRAIGLAYTGQGKSSKMPTQSPNSQSDAAEESE